MTTNELTMLWAKIKSYFTGLFVKKSDFANYDPLIEDTRTSATSVITANAPFATLEDGQRITIKFKFDTASNVDSSLKLTLSDGTETASIPLYGSTRENGSQRINPTYKIKAGAVMPLIYNSTDNGWHTIGDKDTSISTSVTSTLIQTGTDDTPRLISAETLRDNFYTESETDALLDGKADKVVVVNVEQTYTLEVTATAAYEANKSTVDGYIRSFSGDRGEPLIEALESSVSKGYVPYECSIPMGVKIALDNFFASQSQASDFFTYTATLDPVTLQPNRVYQIDNLVAFPDTGDERDHMNTDNVVIALDTSDTSTELKIYTFTFTAESSACQVTLPAIVELGNEYEWVFAPGWKFEVSIMDNVALVAYVDTQTTNS